MIVGTKVRLPTADFGRIADAVAKSLEASLARYFVLIGPTSCTCTMPSRRPAAGKRSASDRVPGDVVPAFQRLRQQGKTRFLGLTAVGDTAALHQVIDAPSGPGDLSAIAPAMRLTSASNHLSFAVSTMLIASPMQRQASSSWPSSA